MVIAWVAFGVSVLSLGWQILSWIKSGSRIVVKSAEELIFIDPSRTRIVVVVINVGRLATTVQQVGLDLPKIVVNGKDHGPVKIRVGEHERDELPKRLESGDELLVRFDGPEIADLMYHEVKVPDFVPCARSGRKWITGKYAADEHRVDFRR